MSSAKRLAVLEDRQRNELESLLMDFDQAWSPTFLEAFSKRIASLPNESSRSIALVELVKIDLQRQWSAGSGRMLDQYLRDFPSLGAADSVDPDLIVAEYDARRSVDPQLDLASYASRFPRQFTQVKEQANQLLDSVVTDLSTPKRTEREPAQASVDTSRLGELGDTKAGKGKDRAEELPTEFGRYRIIKKLGSGAMGTVYLAHDSQLDRQVALKTPSFQGTRDDELVKRFYREARAAAKIQHRNVCQVFDVGEIDGHHFISMAFVKGRCMSEFIKPDRLPPTRTSAILVHRLALALAEAHRHKVIHRDLKPANIMIDLKKEPIVMDFGLARQTDAESRVTQSGMAVGTPAYMSPEQIRGDLDEVGATADIYSLGVILYELLTGQLPFRGPIAKVVCEIVNETPTAPSQCRPDVDAEIEAICGKMMAKKREERYSSMGDVAIALKQYLQNERRSATTTAPSEKSQANDPTQSNASQLTETGALNAFFAGQSDTDSRATQVEPARKLASVSQPTPSLEVSQSNRNHRRFGPRIALGLAGGGALLLGVIIYFNGGKIELDSDSDAVVKVDHDGNVTVRPGSVGQQNAPVPGLRSAVPGSSSAVARPAVPLNPERRVNLSEINPKVRLLNQWEHDGQNWTRWYLASLSPDGRRVAFRLDEGPLTISDTDSKQVRKIPKAMEDATSIAFSSNGQLIATGHDNKTIRVWDADTFAPVGEPFESPLEPNVPWVHLSADGTKLIAMANDNAKLRGVSTFLTWEISTRKLISRFQAGIDDQRHSDSIDASADGRLVAVISLHDGASLWDTTTGKKLPVQFEIPKNMTSRSRVRGMDLSADGSRMAYGVLSGASSYAAILDTSTGKELWNSGKQKGRVHCVQFTDDGKWLASTAGRTKAHQLSLWDVNTGAEVERWTYQYDSDSEHGDLVKFLSFSDDGSRLLLTGGHMPVVVWKLFDESDSSSRAANVIQDKPVDPIASVEGSTLPLTQ